MSMEARINRSPSLSAFCKWVSQFASGVTVEQQLAAALNGWRKEMQAGFELPPTLDNPKFVAAWGDWLGYLREERKLTLGPVSCRKQLALLEPIGPERAAQVLDKAIANGWKSFDFIIEEIEAANKESGVAEAGAVNTNDPRLTSILGDGEPDAD